MLESFSTCFSCCVRDAAGGLLFSPRPQVRTKVRTNTRTQTIAASRVQRLSPHALFLPHNPLMRHRGGPMRISFCYTLACSLLLLSAGKVFGQDTHFATGPQYLTQASGQFARSISTPSLSL